MKRLSKRVPAAFTAVLLAGQLCLPIAATGYAQLLSNSEDLSIAETFTDPKLQSWLLNPSNLGGAGSDGILTYSERQAVTTLDVSGLGLTSLEGLAAFPNLQTLNCSQNNLTRLDLSGNPALTNLSCSYNKLTELDLSQNKALAYFSCSYNRLTRLDLSGHAALRALNCEMNLLTELNLEGCTSLLSLYCRNNLLPQLDLTDNTALEFIETFSNRLTSIDVRHLSQLRFLHIDHNYLTHLDMSGNQKLEGGGFVARNNILDTIILPTQPGLTVYLDDYGLQDPVEGHDRVVWYLDSSFQTPAPEQLEAAGQTLYSQRIPNQYTVYFSPNGGNGSMPSLSSTWGQTIQLPANTFRRWGYTFSHWSRLDNTDYKTLTDQAEVSNLAGKNTDGDRLTLYARWAPNSYTIRLDANQGSGTMEDVAAVFDQPVTLPANEFTRDNLEFAGWSLTPDGSVRYPDEAQVQNLTGENNQVVTLYAVWRTPLSEQQKPYLAQLDAAFQSYSSEDSHLYTSEDWDALCDAYDQASAEIRAAQTTGAMAKARDRGLEAMSQIPTLTSRISQVTQGWQADHRQALAYLNTPQLTQSNAADAAALAQQAIDDLTPERLAAYSSLSQPGALAQVLGAAAEDLQSTGNNLASLLQSAQWLSQLEEGLTSRPMEQVYPEHLEVYQAATEAYQTLDSSLTAHMSSSVWSNLQQRYEISSQKRSAVQSLQQDFDVLDQSAYSPTGQAALSKALRDGFNAIRSASSVDGVLEARKAAWITISQVPTADQEATSPPAGGGDSGTGGGSGGGTGGGSTGGGGGEVPTPEVPEEDTIITVTDPATGASAVVTTTPTGAVSAQVTLPQGVPHAVLHIPCSGGPGTVAFLVSENGSRTVLPSSVLRNGALSVRIDRSAYLELADNTKEFVDLDPGAWYTQPVTFVASRELFSGVAQGQFAPNLSMSRAMVVTVLHKLAGQPTPSQAENFQDIPSGAWYEAAANWALEQGITSGIGGNIFAPDGNIAREDLALMLYRYAQKLGLASEQNHSLSGFQDAAQVSSWAQEAMAWACGNSILSGDPQGRLNPQANSTRAEVSTMLYRFVELFTAGTP